MLGVALGAALGALIALASCAVVAACEGEVAACDGEVSACDGEAAAGCAGVGSAAGVDVMACGDGDALGAGEVALTLADSVVDDVAAGSLVTSRLLSREAVALLFECDALALGAGVTSFSFAGLVAFAGGVDGNGDSAGMLGVAAFVSACATVVVEALVVLVSATLGVARAATALRTGFATMTCEAT